LITSFFRTVREFPKCSHCSKTLRTLSGLKRHKKGCLKKCRFCPKTCQSDSKRKKHEKTHKQEYTADFVEFPRVPRPYKRKTPICWYCCYCETKSSSNSSIRKHTLKEHKKTWFGCNPCKISLHDVEERIKHLDSCPNAVSCDLCTEKFDIKHSLSLHFLSKHLGVKPKLRRYMPCERCGKMLRGRTTLEKHVARYHEEMIDTIPRKMKCSFCHFRTNNTETLERHEKTHSLRYFCQFCGKSFSTNCYLLEHQNVHTGVRPFQCPQCDKTFTRKTYLKSHLKVHVKSDESIKCKICRVCNGRFTLESFEDHAASCTEPPPCPVVDIKVEETVFYSPTFNTFVS